MAPNFRRLLNRLRSKVAVIADSLIASRATPQGGRPNFQSAKDMPVLRIDYATPEEMLPGMR
jgi:hypothetical protein